MYLWQLCLSLAILALFGWLSLALWFRLPAAAWVRAAAVAIWLSIALLALAFLWCGRALQAVPTVLLPLAVFALWWRSIRPSNTRDWADDVAHHLSSEVAGDLVTLRNVRNFAWRSNEDYEPRWETRHYDLRTLCSLDLAVSYWMGPAIGHTLVSFGFSQGPHLTFSVEIRKKRSGKFSAIGGFFKQFERTLVAADERDILRVRSNVRGEDVYLYRVANMQPEAMRSLFLAYLEEAEALRREPRWYNTITANCTTIVYAMARHVVGGLPLDYRIVLSGYLPNYLYDVGALTPGFDFATLRRAGWIVERAKAADESPDFSARIRQGIPGMEDASPG